eukprot:12398554-Ditylum_brightwellii.AAC.1
MPVAAVGITIASGSNSSGHTSQAELIKTPVQHIVPGASLTPAHHTSPNLYLFNSTFYQNASVPYPMNNMLNIGVPRINPILSLPLQPTPFHASPQWHSVPFCASPPSDLMIVATSKRWSCYWATQPEVMKLLENATSVHTAK